MLPDQAYTNSIKIQESSIPNSITAYPNRSTYSTTPVQHISNYSSTCNLGTQTPKLSTCYVNTPRTEHDILYQPKPARVLGLLIVLTAINFWYWCPVPLALFCLLTKQKQSNDLLHDCKFIAPSSWSTCHTSNLASATACKQRCHPEVGGWPVYVVVACSSWCCVVVETRPKRSHSTGFHHSAHRYVGNRLSCFPDHSGADTQIYGGKVLFGPAQRIEVKDVVYPTS